MKRRKNDLYPTHIEHYLHCNQKHYSHACFENGHGGVSRTIVRRLWTVNATPVGGDTPVLSRPHRGDSTRLRTLREERAERCTFRV
jgi:hypothetical protein